MLNEQQKQLLETVQAQIAAGQHLVLKGISVGLFERYAQFLAAGKLSAFGEGLLIENSRKVAALATKAPTDAERIAALEQQITQALARNATLEAALKPFADAGVYMMKDAAKFDEFAILLIDSHDVHGGIDIRCIDLNKGKDAYLRFSNLRNAAAALKGDSDA